MEDLKLLGAFPSPFVYRVIWALKLKGIDYQYIQEDLPNKSALLLQHNPVHKKIPVLVHGGKGIPESLIILEYIEETWPSTYPLLPKHPYERSVAKFWAKFADDKGMNVWLVFFSDGDAKEKAIQESLEYLRIIEDQALGEKKFFGGDVIGFTDLAFGWVAHWMGAIEEAAGVKLMDAQKFPRLHAWMQNFTAVSVVKENLPDRNGILDYIRRGKEMMLASQPKVEEK